MCVRVLTSRPTDTPELRFLDILGRASHIEAVVSPLDRDLIALGLAPKEAAVYLALLELGTASVQAVSRRSGIVRPTTYVILEQLARKGLVSKVTGADAKKMLFTTEDPSRLTRLLQEQSDVVEQRRQDLNRLLPELHSFYMSGEEKPRVRLFEGKEGLQRLQGEFITASKEPIVGLAPEEELVALFPPEEYNRVIRSVRVQGGIHSRHIAVTAQPASETDDPALLRERRILSPEKLPIKASFAVHGPLLSIVSFRSKIIGVLVEHVDIADSFQAIFEILWNIAEPPRPLDTRTARGTVEAHVPYVR